MELYENENRSVMLLVIMDLPGSVIAIRWECSYEIASIVRVPRSDLETWYTPSADDWWVEDTLQQLDNEDI